jgi:hypothetical protein
MDWRILGAGLIAGLVLTIIPVFFGPSPDPGGGPVLSHSTFSMLWAGVASDMQYPLVASLLLVITGIVWKGSMRRGCAWGLVAASFALGCWMLLSAAYVSFTTIDYPGGEPATIPAQNLLFIGLAVPTLGFVSSLAWLFWDGRHNPGSASIPWHWNPAETQATRPVSGIGDRSGVF